MSASATKSMAELEGTLAAEREKNEFLLRELYRLRKQINGHQRSVEMAETPTDAAEALVREARLVGLLEERLERMGKEKVQLENELEQEQERIVNRLQRQLDALISSGSAASNGAAKQGFPSPLAVPTASCLGSAASSNVSLVDIRCGEEARALADRHCFVEREAELHRQIDRLQHEVQHLLVENVNLRYRLLSLPPKDAPGLESKALSGDLCPPAASTAKPSKNTQSGSLGELHTPVRSVRNDVCHSSAIDTNNQASRF